MCCRYYFARTVAEEMEAIANRKADDSWRTFEGEIGPGDRALLLVGRDGKPDLSVLRWGIPGPSGLYINARSETVRQKRSFSFAAEQRRCIIPAMIYYEWDRDKRKRDFQKPDHGIFFMAGIYGLYEGEERFTVLTCPANPSIERVHDRMPLIFDRRKALTWILRGEQMPALLKEVPGPMEVGGYEQLSLFDL